MERGGERERKRKREIEKDELLLSSFSRYFSRKKEGEFEPVTSQSAGRCLSLSCSKVHVCACVCLCECVLDLKECLWVC